MGDLRPSVGDVDLFNSIIRKIEPSLLQSGSPAVEHRIQAEFYDGFCADPRFKPEEATPIYSGIRQAMAEVNINIRQHAAEETEAANDAGMAGAAFPAAVPVIYPTDGRVLDRLRLSSEYSRWVVSRSTIVKKAQPPPMAAGFFKATLELLTSAGYTRGQIQDFAARIYSPENSRK